MFDAGKSRMIGLLYGEKNCDDMLSCFHLIPEQTDRCAISIFRVSMLMHDKNVAARFHLLSSSPDFTFLSFKIIGAFAKMQCCRHFVDVNNITSAGVSEVSIFHFAITEVGLYAEWNCLGLLDHQEESQDCSFMIFHQCCCH